MVVVKVMTLVKVMAIVKVMAATVRKTVVETMAVVNQSQQMNLG
jgi:hypothetical protein